MKNSIIKVTGFIVLLALMFLNVSAFEGQKATGSTLGYAVSMSVAQAEGGGGGTGCTYSSWTCAQLQNTITSMKNNGAPCYAVIYQYNEAVNCNPNLRYCNTNLHGCN